MSVAEPGNRRIALVTGAHRGLGKEVSRQLAETGMTVLVAAPDVVRGRASSAELASGGLDTRFVHLDSADADTVQATAEWVADEFGRLDLLVNSAGGPEPAPDPSTPLDDLGADDLRAVLDTNLVGPFAVIQAFLPVLRVAGGRVVNVFVPAAEDSGKTRADLIPYHAAVAALNMITVLYADQLREAGVRVYAVQSGPNGAHTIVAAATGQ